MGVLLKNNAVSRLGSSITSGSTSLSVTTGQGALFPSPGAGEWFPVTLIKATGSLEIVRCTARSGDVLTVARAQEGTAAQAFTAGDRVELRLTSAVIADVIQQITDLSGAALLDANNLSDLGDEVEARSNLGLGTAATANMTTSATDTTAGRAMKYGDFGLGNTLSLGTQDLNVVVRAGFHAQPSDADATIARHYPVASAGTLIVNGITSGTLIQSQIYIVYNTGEIYVRSFYNGAAFPWRKIYDTGNTSATIQSLLAATTAATARAAIGVPSGTDKQVCTAWVNFNGTGTVAIRDSFNVSSITDNGSGDYTANFQSAMDTATYSVVGSAASASTATAGASAGKEAIFSLYASSPQSVSGVRFRTNSVGGDTQFGAAPSDMTVICVQIFGGKN